MGEKQPDAEVHAAAQTLSTIRMLLEDVSMEMLTDLLESVQNGWVRYQTLGPMLDPTDWQRHGADKERDFDTQIAAARALIDLKKAWRQDVPLKERIREEMKDGRSIDERIQEELDRDAPKDASDEPEFSEWMRERDERTGGGGRRR